MSGSLTRGGRENVSDIPGATQLAILRIWQEAHVRDIDTQTVACGFGLFISATLINIRPFYYQWHMANDLIKTKLASIPPVDATMPSL